MRRAEEQMRYRVIEKIYSSARKRYECEREQYRFACGSHADGDCRRNRESRKRRHGHMHGVKQQRAPEHDGRAEIVEVEPERNSERDEYRREHHEHARKKTRGVEVGALDTETVVDVDGLFIRNESEQQNAEQNRYHNEQSGVERDERFICRALRVEDKDLIRFAH